MTGIISAVLGYLEWPLCACATATKISSGNFCCGHKRTPRPGRVTVRLPSLGAWCRSRKPDSASPRSQPQAVIYTMCRESNSRFGPQRSLLRPSLATGAAPRVFIVKPRPRTIPRPPTLPAERTHRCGFSQFPLFTHHRQIGWCARFAPLRGIGVAVSQCVGVVVGLPSVTLRLKSKSKAILKTRSMGH